MDGTGREVEVVWVRTQPRRALLLLVTVLAVSLAAMAAVAWFGPPAGASSPLHHPGRPGWTEKGPNLVPSGPALPPVSLTAVPPSQWAAPGPTPPGSLTQTITVALGHGQSGSTQPNGEPHGHGHVDGPTTLSVGSPTDSPGQTVWVQGNGFRSGAPVHLSFAVPCADCTADAIVAHPDTSGGFVAGVPITSLSGPVGEAEGDNAIVADQPASGLRAAVALTVVPVPATSPPSPTTLTSAGELTQTITVAIEPGPLTISQQTSQVTLQPVDTSGTSGNGVIATGNLDPVTVTDARGSLGGWTVTGQLTSDFTTHGRSGRTVQLDDAALTWNPSVSLAVPAGQPGGPSGLLNEVAAGAPLQLTPGHSSVLCSASPGGGGGQFECGAGLEMAVPRGAPHGTYSADLELIVIGF
ncbi:MAG: hypothetical protein ACYCU7_07955 [Acidimicrobiales bacterium]